MLVLVEMAVVLCSMLLVALPGIATDQTMQEVSANTITTALEDDYVLEIYGNANEDDTIDMRDLTYVKLIFFGKKPETELADAKYDGKINPLDFIQIKLIIVGKEKELTFLDGYEEMVTVTKPVERIVSVWCTNNELLKVLDATDKLVGVDGGMTKKSTTLFPELSDLSGCGSWYTPDFEAILSLHPDIYIPWVVTTAETKSSYGIMRKRYLEEKLQNIPVLCIDNSEYRTREYFVEEVRKLGYILDRKERAEEFIKFYKGCMSHIVERTESLSEDQKPKVWITSLFFSGGQVTSSPYAYVVFDPTDLAGARNIAADMGPISPGANVDLEWVIEQNPDYIFLQIWAAGNRKSPYAPDYPISKAEEQVKVILKSPELANVNAVKNRRVYVVQYSHFTKGPARSVCIAYMAKLFHPEIFEDLNPQEMHQEYVDQFLGIDVDVNSANFLYPALEEREGSRKRE